MLILLFFAYLLIRLVSLTHPLCQPNTTSPKVLLLRNPSYNYVKSPGGRGQGFTPLREDYNYKPLAEVAQLRGGVEAPASWDVDIHKVDPAMGKLCEWNGTAVAGIRGVRLSSRLRIGCVFGDRAG